MELKLFVTVFTTVFLAELGDKTQLATLLYASDASHPKLTVFLAAALALVLSTGIGVAGGALVGEVASARVVRSLAGMGFLAVGLWMLIGPR